MADGLELYNELSDKLKALQHAVNEYRETGIDYAEKEKDYRIAKAEKILQLRNEGFPATITIDCAVGCSKVSSLRFERDCARVLYDASKESINSIKLAIRIIENQIQREFKG